MIKIRCIKDVEYRTGDVKFTTGKTYEMSPTKVPNEWAAINNDGRVHVIKDDYHLDWFDRYFVVISDNDHNDAWNRAMRGV